ncbi:MAG: hypothetical protein ACI9IV_000376 [Paracoccaceae bacterium]|jgi:hypothetical protein
MVSEALAARSISDNEDSTAQNPSAINTEHTMALWKIWPRLRHPIFAK